MLNIGLSVQYYVDYRMLEYENRVRVADRLRKRQLYLQDLNRKG